MLHDGPGTKSPIITITNRNHNYYSSGFQVFIVSFVENGTFSYHTQPMTTYINNQKIIQLESSQNRNVIFATHVFGFHKIIIHHLRIDNLETMSEIGGVCNCGALYVMAKKDDTTHWFHHFCNTDIMEDFVLHTFHETSTDSQVLYVYFYAGYSRGEVRISIENSNCFHLQSTHIYNVLELPVDCVQTEELIFPDQENVIMLEGEFFNPGPLSLYIQLEEAVYSSNSAIKMFADEIDPLYLSHKKTSRFIAARQYLTFDNLKTINLTFLHGPRQLRTYQLLLVTVEMKSLCRNEADVSKFDTVIDNEKYIVARAIGFCFIQVKGSSVYTFDILARFSQHHIGTVIIGYASPCAVNCQNVTTQITEYNQQLDTKYIYEYLHLPIWYYNIRSFSSVHITVQHNKTECSSCVLTIQFWAATNATDPAYYMESGHEIKIPQLK